MQKYAIVYENKGGDLYLCEAPPALRRKATCVWRPRERAEQSGAMVRLTWAQALRRLASMMGRDMELAPRRIVAL